MSIEAETRKTIIKTFQEHPKWTFKHIAKSVRVCSKTVSNVIKRFNKNLTIKRQEGSGRKSGFQSPRKAKKIITHFERNPNISLRKIAQKVHCSHGLVQKVKKKNGLKTYKVQKVPDRNATKNVEAKKRAKLLKRDFFQKFECCVMDDETYVYGDFNQLPGQEYYVASTRGNVNIEFRQKKVSKFPKKFLIWQAICTCGQRSSFYVHRGTINTEIYIKECLQKRLLPFLRKHDLSAFFWPDLASCHYSNVTKKWYEANGVAFVSKEANPPNCPELRPIERYWALVKRNLKETKKITQNENDLRAKWRGASGKVTETTIKRMMEGIPEKIREFCKK